jgi:hypothetical protein
VQIAPGVDASVWIALSLDEPASPNWQRAIEILDARIKARYLDPVDVLIKAEADKPAIERRFGFAVLAIDCLLVETLGAFLLGLEHTEYKSRATFCSFLTTRPAFSPDFTPALADTFYADFRSGILHQAEVGGLGKVWSVGPLVWQVDGALTINRNEFHSRLKSEFRRYQAELADRANADLRARFRKKMNFIARASRNGISNA